MWNLLVQGAQRLLPSLAGRFIPMLTRTAPALTRTAVRGAASQGTRNATAGAVVRNVPLPKITTPSIVLGVRSGANVKPTSSVIDTITDPNTYRQLAGQAERVLQKPLPGPFSGPNFANIPTSFANLIGKLEDVPAGLARTAQTGIVNRAIQEAAGILPKLPPGASQVVNGALRAPVIGNVSRNVQRIVTTSLPQNIIDTGAQFARDPALRREFLKQFGNTSEKAAIALAGGGAVTNAGLPGGFLQGLKNTAAPFFRAAQNFGPTALNPLATRTPTTRLGRIGSFLNPLNPVNFGGYAADVLIGTAIPENLRGTARAALYTPGGPGAKVISAGLYDLFLNPSNAGVGLNPGTLEANDPEAYRALQAFKNNQAQQSQRPLGSLSILNGNEVEWRGKDLGWQRTYSEGANAPPSVPDLNTSLYSGPQAGQWTPPTPPARPGVVSNGAGVPAQRQNVLNRALSQEILNAAQQYAAPANVPLSSFYEGQQQLGRSMMQKENLLSELQRLNAAPGMTPENLRAWAEQNPDLAYREYLRLKQNQ